MDRKPNGFIDELLKNESQLEDRIEYILGNSLKVCDGRSRMAYIRSMNRLYSFKPKYHKGIPQCQEVVQYRPQLLKLSAVLGPDKPSLMLHSVNPITGSRILELCKIKPLTDDSAELLISCQSRTLMNLMDFEGDKMPVALCIGGKPVYNAVASLSLPQSLDPYFFAGFLDCAAIKVVRCLTQALSVPVDCDFVIEGYIAKKSLDNSCNGVKSGLPVVHITGITHRKGALEAYLEGDNGRESRESMEDIRFNSDNFTALREKILLHFLKSAADRDIVDLYLPQYGNGTDMAIIKIKKRYPCHAVKVAHALWGSNQFMLNKILLVVDESVTDLRDNIELSQAIFSNYNPKTDTLFSRGPADITDKSTPVTGFGGKICIDATVKSSANQTAQASIQTDSNNVLSGSVKAIKFIHKGDELPLDPPVIIIVGKELNINDTVACLRYVVENADPIRNSSYVGNQLVIDIS